MARIATMQVEGRWDEAGAWLAMEAMRLERAGAEVLALATNTLHKCAPEITSAISIPFLHIVDPLIAKLHSDSGTVHVTGHSSPKVAGGWERAASGGGNALRKVNASGVGPLLRSISSFDLASATLGR